MPLPCPGRTLAKTSICGPDRVVQVPKGWCQPQLLLCESSNIRRVDRHKQTQDARARRPAPESRATSRREAQNCSRPCRACRVAALTPPASSVQLKSEQKLKSLALCGLSPSLPLKVRLSNRTRSDARFNLSRCRNHVFLNTDQRFDSTHPERHQLIHLRATEGLAFRRSLQFNKPAVTRTHDV